MWASLPLASSPEHCLPRIQFLFIGSRLCSTLLSDLTSRLGPCVSLSLHLHLVVKRTCTSKLSIMLGTPKKSGSPNSSESRSLSLFVIPSQVPGFFGAGRRTGFLGAAFSFSFGISSSFTLALSQCNIKAGSGS
jgi:hypothetical protein